jgi:hypothetical protein
MIICFALVTSCSSGGGGTTGGTTTGDGPGGGGAEAKRLQALIDDVPAASSGELVILDGSRSSDPSGDALVYSWSQVSGPTVTHSDAGKSTLYFTAPEGTAELVFELSVTNSGGLSSKATTTVAVAQIPLSLPPTSIDLIEEAVRIGTLTAEQGLVYKVFAVFNDGSLPAQYQGRGLDQTSGTRFMAELAEKYDSLSPEAKAQVYPYLLPPYVVNSWYDLAQRSGKLSGKFRNAASLAAAPAAASWKWVTNGKVKVWYQDGQLTYYDGSSVDHAALAQGVLDVVNGKIWDTLHDLMKRDPLPDAGVPMPPLPDPEYGWVPGPLDADGALDIVLCSGMNASGYTVPYHGVPTPAFITIDYTMWKLGDERTPGLVQIVAHELMHAWQFSYVVKDDPGTYLWLMEATAAWAEDYVYPDANSENRYATWYLDTVPLTIDNLTNLRQYGAYTAFSYWTHSDRGGPPDIVRQAWEAAATKSSLDAPDSMNPLPEPMNSTAPHYRRSFFERYWGDFLVHAWNRGANGFFFSKDKLAVGSTVRRNTPIEVIGTDLIYYLDDLDKSGKIELPYLSGRYYYFFFLDDDARTMLFFDGLRSSLTLMGDDTGAAITGVPLLPDPNDPSADPAEGATWRLLAKIGGEWKEWQPSEMSEIMGVPFCRDAKAERLDALVVILGNSSADKANVVRPKGELPPLLLASNMGCWGWTGTFTHTKTPASGFTERTTATVEWRRVKDVFPAPGAELAVGGFVVKSGQFHTEVTGQLNDCTFSGNDSWSWDAATDAPENGPDASLTMLPQAPEGTPLYRAYNGWGNAGGHPVSYTMTCPGGSTTSDFVPEWWKATPGMGTDLPIMSADGTELKGTLDVNDDHYEWSIRSVRE